MKIPLFSINACWYKQWAKAMSNMPIPIGEKIVGLFKGRIIFLLRSWPNVPLIKFLFPQIWKVRWGEVLASNTWSTSSTILLEHSRMFGAKSLNEIFRTTGLCLNNFESDSKLYMKFNKQLPDRVRLNSTLISFPIKSSVTMNELVRALLFLNSIASDDDSYMGSPDITFQTLPRINLSPPKVFKIWFKIPKLNSSVKSTLRPHQSH